MTSANNTIIPPRATVRIPTGSGEEIEAWVYRPAGDGPHPAVVMAHGFAAVKAGGLQPFAERFSREGFTAVAFDYRQWGGSSGQPREEVSVPRQRADYRTVIDWAIADPDIDETQIFIWGTSFSGLHAVEIAATDTRLRGAIAQNPLVDGLAGTKMAQPSRLLHLFAVGVLDRLGSLLGRPPRYVPAGVAAGEFGAVANAAASPAWTSSAPGTGLSGTTASSPARCSALARTGPCEKPPISAVRSCSSSPSTTRSPRSGPHCAWLTAPRTLSCSAAAAITTASTKAARTSTE